MPPRFERIDDSEAEMTLALGLPCYHEALVAGLATLEKMWVDTFGNRPKRILIDVTMHKGQRVLIFNAKDTS